MLIREEQVAFCEKCTNRKPSLQGLLCKLTDEKAAFEETCSDFELDEQEQTNLDKQRRDAAKGDYVGAEIEVGILNGANYRWFTCYNSFTGVVLRCLDLHGYHILLSSSSTSYWNYIIGSRNSRAE